MNSPQFYVDQAENELAKGGDEYYTARAQVWATLALVSQTKELRDATIGE